MRHTRYSTAVCTYNNRINVKYAVHFYLNVTCLSCKISKPNSTNFSTVILGTKCMKIEMTVNSILVSNNALFFDHFY
jgi:hypothetical protein